MTRAKSNSENELPGLPRVDVGARWSLTTLGDVAEFYNGDRSSNYPKQSDFVVDGVPFVNTGHIDPTGRLALNEMNYITRECFDRLRAGKLMPGDIVYCLRGSTIGKIARVALDEGAIASSLVIIRPKANATQDYLYFFLSSPLGQRLVRQHDNGSAQPNLSVQAISKYPILLPSISEQRTIGSILNSLDDKIEQNRRTSRALEALARATFKAWFVDFEPVKAKAAGAKSFPGMPATAFDALPSRLIDSELGPVPEGWEVLRWRDVATLEYGKGLRGYEDAAGAVRVFGTNGPIGWHSEQLAQGPGVIIGRKGAYRGIHYSPGAFWAIDTAFYVKPKRQLEMKWVYYQFLRLDLNSMDSGSAIPSTSREEVYGLPVCVPNNLFFRAFDTITSPLFELRLAGEVESEKLAAVRDYLLPRLLSGRVRVNSSSN